MASRGINKVILVGNLGQDPEVRFMPTGGAVAHFTLATSEKWNDKQTGQAREKTEWHRVVLFGKIAEVAGEYLKKGSQVYIEGQLQTRKWQDQNGIDRFTTEVVVQPFRGVMQMLGGTSGDHRSGWGQPQQPAASQHQSSPGRGPSNHQPAPQSQPQYNEPPMDFDDDIPFRDTFARGARTAYTCS